VIPLFLYRWIVGCSEVPDFQDILYRIVACNDLTHATCPYLGSATRRDQIKSQLHLLLSYRFIHPHKMEQSLSSARINLLLTQVSQRLRASNAANLPYDIFLVGGAVSVLRGIRSATEDIDFYSRSETAMDLIEDKAEAVAEELGLPTAVMNSNVRLFFEHPVFESAVEKTLAQNDIIFHSDALKVYVVDYGYQLISKVDRMSNRRQKQVSWEDTQMAKDGLDAAYYLHQLIRIRGTLGKPSPEDVRELYPGDGYMPQIMEEVLHFVGETYKAVYGELPFA